MSDTHDFDPNAVVSHQLGAALDFAEELGPERYWTPERMAAARPFALHADDVPQFEPDAPFLQLLRPPGSSVRQGESFGADLDVEELHALAPAFETAPVAGTGSFPYSAVGKLFARIGGADQSATAFVVGERAIVTAGHCVFPAGGAQWVDKVAFAPGFANGPPHGLWTATTLHTLAGWAAQRPDCRLFDLGGAVLDRPIAQVTGVVGWLANIDPHQGPFHSVGYPTQWVSPQFPFDGQEMWRCIGQQIPSSGLLKMANNMSEGASGGPWLIARNDNIYANGVNSFRRSDEPEALSSPYFGAGFVNLIERITA
jgi:V8-like Glu-specific endopeptidase